MSLRFEFRPGRRWRVVAAGTDDEWTVSLFDCRFLTGQNKPLKTFTGGHDEISSLLQKALDFGDRYEESESWGPGCRACTGSPRPPEDCVECDWGPPLDDFGR